MLADVAGKVLALEVDDAEHQRHGLHEAVVAADLVVGAGGRRQVAVTGGVDDHRGPYDQRTGLRLEHHPFGSARLADHAGGKGMQQVAYAGRVKQLQRGGLVGLGVDRDRVPGLLAGSDRTTTFKQAPHELQQRSGDDGLTGSVVGG